MGMELGKKTSANMATMRNLEVISKNMSRPTKSVIVNFPQENKEKRCRAGNRHTRVNANVNIIVNVNP